MATFTKIPDSETPVVSVNYLNKIAKINDNVYGGFTEHMGRCIYGGIYDPGNPLSDENGFRKDVIEAFKELNCPVVRYPGGNFVATYHWLDGVGPKDQRPVRPELAWLGEESNQFGTDEFLKWCEVVGTEPYFALNFGTGTLDEALGWLEYCNSDKNTYYANLRRKNGRDKPYNVKYWALGNEMWGPWQVGQMTKEAYADKAYQWAKAMKLLDPSVVLILCGETGYSTWDSYVLKECVKWDTHTLGGSTTASLIDMHSIHIYTASNDHLKNATAPRSAERAIEITGGLIDLVRIENKVPYTVPAP
ncbi:family 51 glycoside hydrolase, partial [Aureobasidium melanogenum]